MTKWEQDTTGWDAIYIRSWKLAQQNYLPEKAAHHIPQNCKLRNPHRQRSWPDPRPQTPAGEVLRLWWKPDTSFRICEGDWSQCLSERQRLGCLRLICEIQTGHLIHYSVLNTSFVLSKLLHRDFLPVSFQYKVNISRYLLQFGFRSTLYN